MFNFGKKKEDIVPLTLEQLDEIARTSIKVLTPAPDVIYLPKQDKAIRHMKKLMWRFHH